MFNRHSSPTSHERHSSVPPQSITTTTTTTTTTKSARSGLADTQTSSTSREQRIHSMSTDSGRTGGTTQGGNVIGSLIAKLLIKLPHSTGRSSAEVESDPIVIQLITSLITISRSTLPPVLIGLFAALDPLIRQTSQLSSMNMSSYTLESQAILLKVIYQCVISDWQKYATTTDSTTSGIWSDPPELDDNLAKSLLSILISIIRQITFQNSTSSTSSSESWPIPGTFVTKGAAASRTTLVARGKNASGTSVMRYLHCSDVVSDLGLGYRRPPRRKMSPMGISTYDTEDIQTSTSRRHSSQSSPTTTSRRIPMINAAAIHRIERYTGRLVFALSTYNWNVVKSRIASRITYLTQAGEDRPDTLELRLLEWCHLDQGKLVSLLIIMSSSFLHLKRHSQLAVSCLIRHMILNWIDIHTSEYVALIASNRSIDRSVEMLCDFMIQNASSEGKSVRTNHFSPAITALLTVSPDIVERALSENGRSGSSLAKRIAFVEAIRRNNRGIRDLTNLLCQVDILRAAVYLPQNSNPIKMLATEIAAGGEFKEHIMQSAALDEDLAMEGLFALVRSSSVPQGVAILNQGLKADAGDRSKRLTVRTCIILSQEAKRTSSTEFLRQLYPTAAPAIRSMTKTLVGRISSGKQLEDLDLIHTLCQLFRNDLNFALYGCLHSPVRAKDTTQDMKPHPDGLYDASYKLDSDDDGLPQFICSLSALLVQPTPASVRHETAELLGFILETGLSMKYGIAVDDAIKRSIAHSCRVPAFKASVQTIWAMHDILPYQHDLAILHTLLPIVYKIIDQLYTHAGDPFDHAAMNIAGSAAGIALMASSAAHNINIVTTNVNLLQEYSTLQRKHPRLLDPDSVHGCTMLTGCDNRFAIPSDIVGPQMLQKFFRGVLRSDAAPSPGLLAVWRLQFSRFSSLLGRVIGGTDTDQEHALHGRYNVDGLSDDQAQELKNIGCVVAAMSNVCVHASSPSGDQKAYAASLVQAGLPTLFATEEDSIVSLHAYINEQSDLLVADSPFIRSAAQEALGVDLPDSHDAYLLAQLNDLLGHSVATDGSVQGSDAFDTFCWGVLCLLERRAGIPGKNLANFEPVLCKLVQYCGNMTRSVLSLRCRLKVCRLVHTCSDSMPEGVLRTFIDWTSSEVSDDVANSREAEEKRKLQADLDIACLQAYASGSSSLVSRSQLDAERLERNIGQHISWLVGMTNRTTIGDIDSYLITACENLCRLRSGLLYCIKLAQSSDDQVRSMIIQALARSIRNGSLATITTRPEGPRTFPFSEFVLKYPSDFLPVVAPLCRQDEYLVGVLYRIFERKSKELVLLDTVVESEIASTDDASGMFRSNSLCTKLISVFAQSHSIWIYFHNILASFFKDLASKPSDVILDLEEHDLATAQHSRTVDFIQAVCQRMVDRLVHSVSSAPRQLRLLVASVAKHAQAKFGAYTNAVGGIIFLRILCPAMAAPERFGLAVAPELWRPARWCSKIFNVLASGQTFKENMKTFNPFLQANSDKMLMYLQQLPAEGNVASMPAHVNNYDAASKDAESDEIYCRQFINQHLAQIAATAERSQGSMMSSLTQALASGVIVDVHFAGNAEAKLTKLLQRHSERSTARANSVFFEGERCLNGRRLFYLIGSGLDSTYEDGLLSHMIQLLSTTSGEEYDVILDLFGTSAKNGPQPKALTELLAILTKSTAGTLGTLALFLPNFATEGVIRRLLLASDGQLLQRGVKIVAASSPSELLKLVSYNSLQLSAETTAAATSPYRSGINDILYCPPGQPHPIPCIVTLGQKLVIQSRTKQDLLRGVASHLMEVYSWDSLDESFSDRFLGADKKNILDAINEKRGKAATPMVDGNDATQINEIAAALLCTALSNLTVGPRALRQASYDLLMASEPYVTSGRTRVVRCASHLPSNLTMIAVEVMEQCASAKHLTVPFINAWCEAFLAASQLQRPFLARSLPPWIKNLIAMQKDDDNIVLSCLKSLIGLQSLGSVECLLLEQNVWQLFADCNDESMSELATHLIIQRANYIGASAPEFDNLCGTLALIAPADTFARWAARLRKTISSTHTQLPMQSLQQHHAWGEISTQLRILLNLTHRRSSLADRCHIAFGMPDVLYIIIMLCGIGNNEDRICLHALLVNVTLKLAEFAKPGSKKNALSGLHDQVTEDETLLRIFGLDKNGACTPSGHVDGNGERIDELCVLLQKVLEAGTPSTDMANIWFSRLTGLLASTCFQSNSTTQGRAFSALALLIENEAQGQEIEDDLLYQILVAIRSCLLSYSGESGLLTSMLRCLTRAIPLLGQDSRYAGGAAFWMGIGILQIDHQPLFVPVLELLAVTLDVMGKQAFFAHGSLSDVLLAFRQHELHENLDQVTGLSFETSFSFSMLGLLFKGLRIASSRELTIAVLRRCLQQQQNGGNALGYVLALDAVGAPLGISSSSAGLPATETRRDDVDLDFLDDNTATLAVSSIIGMLAVCDGDSDRIWLYRCLRKIASANPDVFSMWQEAIAPRAVSILSSTENAVLLDMVTSLISSTLAPSIAESIKSESDTSSVNPTSMSGVPSRALGALQDMGMDGLLELSFGEQNMDRIGKKAEWAARLFCN